MPFRIDLCAPADDAFDRLVELGALDVEPTADGLAAIMPDNVDLAEITKRLRGSEIRVSPAVARDDNSVWLVSPRPIRVGRIRIVPADGGPEPGALRMVDGPAFGTGLHPTTALCLEMLDEMLDTWHPPSALDVGTGSGILALAALSAGVSHVVAVDIDADAVRVAARNAQLNGLESRLTLIHGGVDAVSRSWPLVFANVLAAPLIEMAPSLVRAVGHGGRLVLSGIRSSLARDVELAYRHLGMRHLGERTRQEWSALILRASW